MEFKPGFATLFSFALAMLCLASFSCRLTETGDQESPIICITFDDGSATVANNALPLLRQYSYPATAFVNTGKIGTSIYMNISQLQALKAEGWEIGGHSLNHEHLSQLAPNEASQAITQDFQNLVTWGFAPKSFALPYGECPHEYYPLISKHYSNIRGSSDFAMHSPIDPHYLSYTSFQSSWTIQQISARISQGVFDHEDLIILGFHTVDPNTGLSEINCDPLTFSGILSYINSRGLRVMTIDQAVRTLKSSSSR